MNQPDMLKYREFKFLIHAPIQLLATKSFLIIPVVLTMIQGRGKFYYLHKARITEILTEKRKKRYSVEHAETDNRKIYTSLDFII